MKIRTGYFPGLAAALVLGVFAAMLALGSLEPRPAAAITSFTVASTDISPGGRGTWTFTMTEAETIHPDQDIIISFPRLDESVCDPATEFCIANVGNMVWTFRVGDGAVVYLNGIGSNSPAPVQLEYDTGRIYIQQHPGVNTDFQQNVINTVVITAAPVTAGGSQGHITNPTSLVRARVEISEQTNNSSGTDYVYMTRAGASPQGPGAAGQYRFEFVSATDMTPNVDTITLHFDKDFGNLGQLDKGHFLISGTHPATLGATSPVLDPIRREIFGGENHGNVEYTITLPDMAPGPGVAGPGATTDSDNSVVTVTLSAGAGIANPTGAGAYRLGFRTSRDPAMSWGSVVVGPEIVLSDYGANRNGQVTVMGKGFKDGTTATVYLDRDKNGSWNPGRDFALTNNVMVAGDDTFQATFAVTVPPFAPGGGNMIGAIDGGAPPNAPAPAAFEVEGLVTVSPMTLGIGDTLSVTAQDWPNEPITSLQIGGVEHLSGRSVAVADNYAHFTVTIASGVRISAQQLRVASATESDTANVVITGADLTARPATAAPGQSVVVEGGDFSGGAAIDPANPAGGSRVTLSGLAVAAKYFNGGQPVAIGGGGNWAASLVLPVNAATLSHGPHELKVVDSRGRTGVVTLNIMERTIALEPAGSRPGTYVTVRGKGFPADNTASGADSIGAVELKYGDKNAGSATVDSAGSFTARIQVPSNARIPSTNTVEAAFTAPAGTRITTRATHAVPEGVISLAPEQVRPGDSLTVTGSGFRAFRSVSKIEIGGLNATPSIRASTDREGNFTTAILVPDLEAGLGNVSVTVGGTVASASVTVASDAAPGNGGAQQPAASLPPEDAFASMIARDNLLQAYHFDPETQSWSFYSPDPNLAILNDLELVEPGRFYFVQAARNQAGVTLGANAMDIYKGWNPMTW